MATNDIPDKYRAESLVRAGFTPGDAEKVEAFARRLAEGAPEAGATLEEQERAYAREMVKLFPNSSGKVDARVSEWRRQMRDPRAGCGSCIHLRLENDPRTGRCMRDNPTFGPCPCEGWRPR